MKNTITLLLAIVFFIYLPLRLARVEVEQAKNHFSPALLVRSLKISEGASAIRLFAAYGYDIDDIRQNQSPVPRLYLSRLPRELPLMRDVKERKKLFITTMLPLILRVNSHITQDRDKLIHLLIKHQANAKLSTGDLYWINRKLADYKITNGDPKELLRRINIIPPSLALTQAAIESGWGTSRFAQKGNALYGQWTWGQSAGMVPKGREAGKTHKIKTFRFLIEAVEGYAHNLNTHKAYRGFREERAKFSPGAQDINVMPLLETLLSYSERGQDYVDTLKQIIRLNRLGDFDHLKLREDRI